MKKYVLLVVGIAAISFTNCRKNNPQPPIDDTPPPVSLHTTHQYGSDARQHFELILPNDYSNQTPVVLIIHGGAWVLGPKESQRVNINSNDIISKTAKQLINAGNAVAIMKYSLACYVTQAANLNADVDFYHTIMMNDIDSCVQKLFQVAVGKGIASNRIAILGESAGAHLALMYGLHGASNPNVKAIVAYFPPTDFTDSVFLNNANITLPILSASNVVVRRTSQCLYQTDQQVNLLWGLRSFVGHNISINAADSATLAPVNIMAQTSYTRELPVFILHGQDDALVPVNHSLRLFNKLQATTQLTVATNISDYEAKLKYRSYPSCGHGWAGANCNFFEITNDVANWLLEQL